MIVIICAKYKKNPSRTADATERTRFSKSKPNDLEDIGQGQGSSHATHPLMLLIICTKYGKNPSWTVDATWRTRKVNEQTDRQTDRRTDRQTGWIQYTPPNFVAGGIMMVSLLMHISLTWPQWVNGCLPIFFTIASLALGSLCHCPNSTEATLKDMGTIDMLQTTLKNVKAQTCAHFLGSSV